MAECHRQHAASVRSPEIACANIPSRQRKSPIKLMPFTTREIESPDPVTRVAAADAALREPGQDDIGEKMVLNMGPSHPATHGVLRLVLELDGEIITKATPDIGFLHRGDEKIAENMQYNQFVPYTDRLDYLAPLSNNVAYALAVEKLMGWEIPPRGKAIRTICCETSRISSHLLGLGARALDRVCNFRTKPAREWHRTRFAPETSVSRLRPVRFRRGHRQRGRLL